MTLIGKTLAGSLLKLIPGVGSLVGGTINAAVASSLTYSLGYALTKLAEMLYLKILDGKFNTDTLNSIITEENLDAFLKEFKNKQSNA